MRKFTKGLTFVAVTNACLGEMSAAYQNTVLNLPQMIIKQFVSDSFLRHYGYRLSESGLTSVYSFCIVSAFFVGGLIGALIAHPIAERFGRRDALIFWTCLWNLIGIACIFFSEPFGAFELLAIGRLFTGISHGQCGVCYGLYITEIAPDNAR